MTDQSPQDSAFSTPMMKQYLALKTKYPDCILMFRLGDFYEMFLDDALRGAKILGITLTSRTRGKDGRIPMAGVPYHAVDGYVAKLLAAGHKVAMCNQLTLPKAGELVERDVTRVLTPGTVITDTLLSHTDTTYCAVACSNASGVSITLADVASGALYANYFSFSNQSLNEVLNKLVSVYEIREWILPKTRIISVQAIEQWLATRTDIHVTTTDSWIHSKSATSNILQDMFPPAAPHRELLAHALTAQAVANLLEYIRFTQKTLASHTHLVPLLADEYLQLDQATIKHLELIPLSSADHTPTLYSTLNRTQTAAGARLLRHWLLKPLTDMSIITSRQDSVGWLLEKPLLLPPLQHQLSQILDMERVIGRLTLNAGTPRDVAALGQSILAAQAAATVLTSTNTPTALPLPLYLDIPTACLELAHRIQTTLTDEPPNDAHQGNLIRTGVHPQLDSLRQVAHTKRAWLAELEQDLRSSTSISSLKIRYNQVFGFYIEVSNANLAHVPAHFVRKQTLVNAERFTTTELTEAENIITQSETQSADLEYALFTTLVTEILSHTVALQSLARNIAQLDCIQSLAVVAQEYTYTKPALVNEGPLILTASRHPVLERLPHPAGFVPNDLELNHSHQQLVVLTGPNMAGKSVLMRQVALITLMAHVGSYVPAQTATIPLTDRIFVRSGAGDAMTQGLSTFMVEMVETAAILRDATGNSLVIMDEIGRGTSTHDGISLAWAVAEYLVTQVQPGPLTLFATHYHELQGLAEMYPDKIKNFHLAITEHAGKLIFLYSLQPGGSSQSHGIKVAELAGIPEWVLKRAQKKLEIFANNTHLPTTPKVRQTSKVDKKQIKILNELQHIAADQTTPLEALQLITKWNRDLNPDER